MSVSSNEYIQIKKATALLVTEHECFFPAQTWTFLGLLLVMYWLVCKDRDMVLQSVTKGVNFTCPTFVRNTTCD